MNTKEELRVVEKRDGVGRLTEQKWTQQDSNAAHRQDGPAVQRFDPESGKLISEIWINQLKGGLHRNEGLPAYTRIDPTTGVVTCEEFHVSGVLSRLDGGPAKILRDAHTGNVVELEYRVEGWLHRDGDQPAIIEYHEGTDQAERVEYYHQGALHRIKGPAIIEFDKNGNQISRRFIQHGKELNATVATLTPKC